jgi:ElaB/YqjD/DUF883 family membrane-anchored ribosome-binding protein
MDTETLEADIDTRTEVTTQKLFQDLKTVVRDGQELLRAGIGDMSQRGAEARAKLATALENAKSTCLKLEQQALEGVKVADKVVRENPYQAMALACGVGFVIGLILTRPSDKS